MKKRTLDKNYLQKIIHTTQKIEGYGKASTEIKKKAQELREKYGIKISVKNHSH